MIGLPGILVVGEVAAVVVGAEVEVEVGTSTSRTKKSTKSRPSNSMAKWTCSRHPLADPGCCGATLEGEACENTEIMVN